MSVPLAASRPLRIAQIAPLVETVPPRQYGGAERVVAYLTDALVALGHDVTLFATADSQTQARLVACAPEALRAREPAVEPLVWQTLQIEALLARRHEFDLVHFHTEFMQLPLRRWLPPHVTTLHGRQDLPDLPTLYRHVDAGPVVSITDAQRTPLPHAPWIATVPHGLPRDLLRPGEGTGGYLAFVGRLCADKGPDRAIEIARRSGWRLKIAAKVDRADRVFFDKVMRPLLDSPGVEFLGEVDEHGKQEVLGGAAALLFPIEWPEPFGLVMIEALACGTPVIAYRNGSVPEVIEHGRSGYIVDDMDAAVAAVNDLTLLSREECRLAFERRYTAERMARDYLDVYATLHAAAARDLPHAPPSLRVLS